MIGNHVTTLSLGPGEEITFTQRQETVRRSAFEQVHTREQETERRLSSTWTTDWSSEGARNTTTNIGGNLGGNLSVPLEFVTIGADIGGSASFSDSHSRSTQLNYTYNLVQDIGRRMREEHKTVIQTSRESSDLFESSRRVVNDNPLRALDLAFYKIFNKEQVTFERFDAKLALNLTVSFPLFDLINNIEQELDRIDPENSDNYNCEPPAASETVIHEFWINLPTPAPLYLFTAIGWQKYLEATPPNSALVYMSHSEPEVIAVERKFSDTGDIEEWNPAEYMANGRIWHEVMPGSPGGLDIHRQIAFEAHQHKTFLGAPGVPGAWWTHRVKVRVAITYVPKPGEDEAYEDCIDAERHRLRSQINGDLLDSIVTSAMRPARDHVFSKVIDEYFMESMLAAGADPDAFVIKELRHLFDWNEAVIQFMPGWMSDGVTAAYESLRDRLSSMLPGYTPGRVLNPNLFSSAAQVVLPIRGGAEERVLDLMTGGNLDMGEFVSEFNNFRDSHYGVIDIEKPDYENVLSPRCEIATEVCADGWTHHWEKPQRRFDVIGQWAEYAPTDGVHIEPSLSVCSAADEARLRQIDIETELASRDRPSVLTPPSTTDDDTEAPE